MRLHSLALAVSLAIPAVFAVRSLLALPDAIAALDYDAPFDAYRWGAICGVIASTIFWLALAYGQWRTRGGWGIALGLLGLVSFAAQTALLYLALQSGRVAPSTDVFVAFALRNALPAWVLVGAGFLAYLKRPTLTAPVF